MVESTFISFDLERVDALPRLCIDGIPQSPALRIDFSTSHRHVADGLIYCTLKLSILNLILSENSSDSAKLAPFPNHKRGKLEISALTLFIHGGGAGVLVGAMRRIPWLGQGLCATLTIFIAFNNLAHSYQIAMEKVFKADVFWIENHSKQISPFEQRLQ
jgi:hypothetical protein